MVVPAPVRHGLSRRPSVLTWLLLPALLVACTGGRPSSTDMAPTGSSGESAGHVWATPFPADDPRDNNAEAAGAAAAVLERAVQLGEADRLRWLSAYAAPGAAPAAATFLERWLSGLLDERSFPEDTAPDVATQPGVRLESLGARTLARGDGGGGVRVILWQRVTVEVGSASTSANILTFVTMIDGPDGPLLAAIEGVRPGPPVDAANERIYREVRP